MERYDKQFWVLLVLDSILSWQELELELKLEQEQCGPHAWG